MEVRKDGIGLDVCRSAAEFRSWQLEHLTSESVVAFIPTSGCLHDAHLELSNL
jgi:pantothenate synthetase